MASPDSALGTANGPAPPQPPVLECFLDHIHDAVITLDCEWRVTYVNQAALALSDRAAAEVLGNVLWEVFPRAVGSTFYNEFHRVAAERRHRHFEEYDALMDRWLESDAYPAENGIVAIIRDITDARKKELVVRDREERLRLALSVGQMGVWELDPNTQRVQWSPELDAMHGLPPGTFDGTVAMAASLVHPDDLPGLQAAVADAIAQCGAMEIESRSIWADGSIHNLYSRGKVICGDRGEVVRFVGITIDISAQKAAARILQSRCDQLQLLFDLAGGVSRARDAAEIYRAAAEGLVRLVGADRAAVLTFDDDGVLRFKAWTGLSSEYRAAVEGHTPWNRDSLDAEPVAVPDVLEDSSLSSYRNVFVKEGIGAIAFIPLMGKTGLIGKFVLYHDRPGDFPAEELRVAQTIATHVAFAAERQQAEAALRASEERFRSAFSQAAVGIAHVGLEGRFLVLNERYCEILGYTHAELCGLTFQDVTHPDDCEGSEDVIRQFLAGTISVYTREKRCLRKDGGIVWARVHVSLARDQHSQPRYFIAVLEDITEKVRAELALRDSQRSLALTQSVAHLGAWESDLAFHQVEISAEYARLHGLPPDQPLLTFSRWLELIHPDDRGRIEIAMRAGVERMHPWDVEYRVVWPNGDVHWLLANGRVHRDDAGRPVRMAGITLDITERKLAEAALLESEERFRNMADTAPVMIWVAGPDKALTFFNKTWLDYVGRTLDQELNNGWVESVHPEDLDRCFASYCSAFDARESFHIEYRLRRADGEYRWVLCSGVPRFAPCGVFAGYIGSDVDITDLRRAQAENFERQKLESLGVLSAGIAHDFNNLLGSILVEAELAESDLPAGAHASEQIRRIKAVAVRASEIVRELMIYSGQDKAELAPVNLSQLVEDMLELIKVSVSKQAALETDLPLNLPAVRGNRAQLRQVVLNLIINASEAIGDRHGVIRVATSLAPGGESLRLQVSDTGCGMTDEEKARIFEPFFTTKFAGRGLGMAVVQGIVRAHGGYIHLTTATGEGTTFLVLLPCDDKPADLPAPAQCAAAEPASSLAGTVLLVEDEQMLCVSLSKLLAKRGLSVIEALDGSAAIDLIRKHRERIDVILLDATIAGSSSRDVISEARRICPDVKVILTSAYSREMVMPSLGAPPVSAFIRKPFPFVDLLEVLRATLLHS